MNLRQSRALGWSSMVLMVIIIIIAVSTRVVSSIWEYSTIFFAFMAIFCHLMALLLAKMSGAASRKLDTIALVCSGLTVIALIVVFILNWVTF